MGTTRKVRLEYYRVSLRSENAPPNRKDDLFDLQLWIDKVRRKSLAERTYDYYDERARLDRLWFDRAHRLWFMSFLRLRETNIPTTAREDREAEPITLDDDEYIGEEAVALYDPQNYIVMLQRNRHSLGPSGIEEYLNLVWGSESERIYLRPIPPGDLLAKVSNATVYRKLTIRFADVNRLDLEDAGGGPLRKLYDVCRQYRAINAEITVTVGYDRGGSLSKETVTDSISDILRNRNLISKAEVGIKENDDASVEVVDLFGDRRHDFIFPRLEKRSSLASEYIAQLMIEKYEETLPTIPL